VRITLAGHDLKAMVRGFVKVAGHRARPELRHTFASWLVNADVPLYQVSALLGHSDISVTQRYSHLSRDPLRQASETVGRKLKQAG
jgi:site-specific recombinase XerD